MKSKPLFLLSILFVIFLFGACSDKDDVIPDPKPNGSLTDEEYTNKWIYDKMKRIYLWNDQLSASPDYTLKPEDFFYGILYKYGNVSGDRFSWIEEDKSNNTRSLFGGGKLGFDYIPSSFFANGLEGETSSLGFFVISVDKGSDAEAKGLKRGQVIYEVNGTKITSGNYKAILGESFSLSIYNSEGVKQTLPAIHASAKDGSPVFMSEVIEASNLKIGYLMYSVFERGKDDDNNNFDYDIELISTINDLKNKGITEFILDLRYNPGGYLTSAMDLASALVPNRSAKNKFLIEEYNSYFQDSLVTKYGQDALNNYFLDKIYGTNVDIPKLNLGRLYVIATGHTASASESIIHGLRPYMDVYHVGETTVGKDKASMTIQANDKRIAWQLQPLISRLSDANGVGNYINGLKPDYEISEWEEGYEMVEAYYIDGNGNKVGVLVPMLGKWKGGFSELGDVSEPLLAEAIAKITGIPRPVKSVKSGQLYNWKAKQVPYIKPNENRYKTIVDENKFINLDKVK